ncbi:hypothetical protein AB4305_29165 [Nocardia sp. 2YAB30]|uniref:TIGR03943 family putative permease subunit n=1 Tax=unclassified Nocardia TaxID=2637762 RepID=UPI003F9C87C5
MRPNDLEQQHPATTEADLARVVITCCVADARYVLVHLAGMPEPIEDGAWLEVRGVVQTDSAQHDPDQTPTLAVIDYQRIPAPDRPYERRRQRRQGCSHVRHRSGDVPGGFVRICEGMISGGAGRT